MSLNEWDDYAADWDSNEDVRSFAEQAIASLMTSVAPSLPELNTCRVLDFGCGTGLLTERLAERCLEIVALDTSPGMIEIVRKKVSASGSRNVVALDIPLTAETIAASPALQGEFDLIVASSVCSFLSDYEGTLGDLASILKPGAFFVQWDWLNRMPPEKIAGAFTAAGLEAHRIDVAFAMVSSDEKMPAVAGIGRKPGG